MLWTALTGFTAVAAVAFFAIWSVLSNMFCAVLIFSLGPFRLGDVVEVVESADKPGVKGRVVAINLFYTTLQDSVKAPTAPWCRCPTACSSRRRCVAGAEPPAWAAQSAAGSLLGPLPFSEVHAMAMHTWLAFWSPAG